MIQSTVLKDPWLLWKNEFGKLVRLDCQSYLISSETLSSISLLSFKTRLPSKLSSPQRKTKIFYFSINQNNLILC